MPPLKYSVGTAIAFLGLATIPPQYARWVVRLADRLQSDAQYERPPPVSEGKMHTASATTGKGGLFKESRIITEDTDGWKHLGLAAAQPFPQPAFDQRVEPSLLAAVDIMMSNADSLRDLQSDQLAMFAECAADLSGLNDYMIATMSESSC